MRYDSEFLFIYRVDRTEVLVKTKVNPYKDL